MSNTILDVFSIVVVAIVVEMGLHLTIIISVYKSQKDINKHGRSDGLSSIG
jgi:hypothetical protein